MLIISNNTFTERDEVTSFWTVFWLKVKLCLEEHGEHASWLKTFCEHIWDVLASDKRRCMVEVLDLQATRTPLSEIYSFAPIFNKIASVLLSAEVIVLPWQSLVWHVLCYFRMILFRRTLQCSIIVIMIMNMHFYSCVCVSELLASARSLFARWILL